MIIRPGTPAQNILKDKYDSLVNIINARLDFENQPKNKISPYIEHPTNFDYVDINGYSLLHYACMTGNAEQVKFLLEKKVDIEKKPLFLIGGITPIEMALRAGHLEISGILFNEGAKCHEILTAKVHPNCIEWFKDKIRESFNESFPEYEQGNFIIREEKYNQFFNDKNMYPFNRISELGDLDLLQIAFDNERASSFVYDQIDEYLMYAASNGHLHLINNFIEKGAKINFISKYKTSSLHAAAENHQYAMCEYLLSLDVNINQQNEVKKTALMLAAENNDIKIVELLKSRNSDALLKDCFGNTILHQAVSMENIEIINLLTNHKDFEKLLTCRNIYGLTSGDIAVDAGFDEAINLLFGNEKLHEIKNNSIYAKKRSAINHRKILPIMYYFLQLNYRDTECLIINGHCTGFTVMRNFYSAKKMKQYFIDTLRVMSSWDGTFQKLHEKFSENFPQARFHITLMSLFDQWIQDIICFQGYSIIEKITQLSQDQISDKFKLFRPSDGEKKAIEYIFRQKVININAAQLNEILSLLAKMPVETHFMIGGGLHSCGGDVRQNNVDYYDPNFQYEIASQNSIAMLSELIVDVKYRAIKQIQNEILNFDCDIYYYKSNGIKMDEFELFSAHEFPDSEEACRRYQEESPCKFTPLHAALFTGSMVSFRKLLENGHCDIMAKDAFNRNYFSDKSIFDIAIETNNATAADLILRKYRDHFDVGLALNELQKTASNQLRNILLLHANSSEETVSVFRQEKRYSEYK